MHARILAAAAAAALALAWTSASAADDFRGTFRGTWPDGQTTEITVVRIDDNGDVYGAYCHRSSRHVRHFLFDLHPTDGISARLEDDALRFTIGTGDWAFRRTADPNVVRLAFRRTKTRELDLERADEQTCASRLRQVNPPTDAPPDPSVAEKIPDDPDHWAVGAWAASLPAGFTVELTLFDVKKNRGHGIYCTVGDGPTYTVVDVHPDGLDAKLTRNKIKFRLDDNRYEFKRTREDDTLDGVRRHKGSKRTIELTRTSEPACAGRVVPR